MLIISGNCGNYISFGSAEDAQKLIKNLKVMLETNDQPLLYGFTSDKMPKEEFDVEFDALQEMIANDLIMRARAGG